MIGAISLLRVLAEGGMWQLVRSPINSKTRLWAAPAGTRSQNPSLKVPADASHS